MQDPCQEASSTEDILQELQEMALDPTLDQCCRRDIESQIYKERLRQSLQQHDRIDTRQRLASSAICRDSKQLAALQNHQCSQLPQAEEYQQKNGADRELEQLRLERLRQLKAQSALHQAQHKAGSGALNTLQESKLLALISDPPGRGLLVVHLAVQGHEPCNTLDECLEAAAAQFRGTYFARVVVSRSTGLVSRLQLPHGVPALLVCKHGGVLGKASIQQFGQHDVWDEEVLSYLRRFRVLSTRTADAGQSAGVNAGSSTRGSCWAGDGSEGSTGSDSDQAADDWQPPCEMCGRCYPHTHVRAIYSSDRQGDAASSEAGDD